MLVFFLPEFSGDSSFNWRNLSYWFNKSFWWCQFTLCTICMSLTAASACNFVQLFFGSAKTIPATMIYWQKTFSNLAARSLPKLQYRTVKIFGGAYSCEWCFGCILWIPILTNFERKSWYLFFKLFLRMLLVKSVKLQTKRKKKKRIPVGISASYVSLHEKHNKYLLQKLTHLIIS